MKLAHVLALPLLSSVALLHGADSTALSFPPQKIGAPELSLQESLARKSPRNGNWTFQAQLPNSAAGSSGPALPLFAERSPHTPRAPVVAPRTVPKLRTIEGGLLILKPDDAIDYTLRIIEPDSSIDPKMLIEVGPPPAKPEK
jgi:hypothetical protein